MRLPTCESGVGTDKNPSEAVYWYMRSAEKGYALAQNDFGSRYSKGQLGLNQDYKRAFDYFQLAAVQGLPQAQMNIAAMYHYGRFISKDYKWQHNLRLLLLIKDLAPPSIVSALRFKKAGVWTKVLIKQ
jgi:hypothetical protein